MNDETAVTIYRVPERMTLQQTILAWLDEKRADSVRTADAYETTLKDFRDTLRKVGLDLDSEPALVAPLAQGWARQSKREGETVTASTFNQRRSVISSFYKYAIIHEVLTHNPLERVKRQKPGEKDAAHHLSSDVVKTGLAKIDRSTPQGLRDYALLCVMLETGRRVSEIAGMRYQHLQWDGNTCVVSFPHCKGKKSFTNLLPTNTTRALLTYLECVYPGQLGALPGDAPVWVSFSDRNDGQALGTRTLSNICKAYLGTSKTHAPRHTLAVRMHHLGAKVTDISKALGHSNIKITTDYLDEHLSYENPLAAQLEEEWGIE